MKIRAKFIIIFSCIFIAFFLITVCSGVYYIYKDGEKNGLLEDEGLMDSYEYQQKINMLKQQENSIILEEKKLETQYVNKEILYEEYKSRKQQLEIQKIVLRDNILILEKEYGVDDTYEN